MLVVSLSSQEVCDQIERELSTQVAERNHNESSRLEDCAQSTLILNPNALITKIDKIKKFILKLRNFLIISKNINFRLKKSC